MSLTHTPYIIHVFATGTRTIGKGKRQRTQTIGYGYMGWTSVQHYQEARLPGAGSFLYPGFIRARQAALAFLRLAETHQVCVKTNQSRDVYRWFKAADGTVSGYAGEGI